MAVIIEPVRSREDFAIAGQLVGEYVAWLGIDLSFQDFEREIADLARKYSFPASGLFLASISGRHVGCAGFAPFGGDGACELKRLFVRPDGRGAGVGNALLAAAIAAASRFGYREMLLDTLPSMTAATRLYRSAGFVQTSPYYANPVRGAIFFRKVLPGSGTGTS